MPVVSLQKTLLHFIHSITKIRAEFNRPGLDEQPGKRTALSAGLLIGKIYSSAYFLTRASPVLTAGMEMMISVIAASASRYAKL